MTLSVVENPSDVQLAPLQASDEINPFATIAYVTARRHLGAKIVLFAHECGFTVGYLYGRAISRYLEIATTPSLPVRSPFWSELLEYCGQRHVAELDLGSYGSTETALPEWRMPAETNDRIEWVVQLGGTEPARFASNHRRNIHKALKAGFTTTITTDPSASYAHRRVMAASMQRRSKRGEAVPSVEENDTHLEHALLAAGAGRLHQAVLNGTVLSSLLVLDAPNGAYYQSAGTAPEGMESGASTFLVSEVIKTLTAEGKSVFNLGGAGSSSEGLQRFKSGFGAQPVSLESAKYHVASPMHRKLRSAVQLLREPTALPRSIMRRFAAV